MHTFENGDFEDGEPDFSASYTDYNYAELLRENADLPDITAPYEPASHEPRERLTSIEVIGEELPALDLFDTVPNIPDAAPVWAWHGYTEPSGAHHFRWGTQRTTRIDENQLLANYGAFLGKAADVLRDTELAAVINEFGTRSSYVSRQAMERAIAGIAMRQADYINATGGRVIMPLGHCGEHSVKSYDYIMEQVKERILAAHPDMEDHILPVYIEELPLMRDVRSTRDNDRIVWLDDWVVSGEQMARRIHASRPYFSGEHATEINLIAARQGQTADKLFSNVGYYGVRDVHDPPNLVAFWHTPDISGDGPVPFGWHGSSDRGFQDTILTISRQMALKLETMVRHPYASSIAAPYRS